MRTEKRKKCTVKFLLGFNRKICKISPESESYSDIFDKGNAAQTTPIADGNDQLFLEENESSSD